MAHPLKRCLVHVVTCCDGMKLSSVAPWPLPYIDMVSRVFLQCPWPSLFLAHHEPRKLNHKEMGTFAKLRQTKLERKNTV